MNRGTYMSHIHIAIDGPAGAGKSTVAKVIAQKLNITYIDTGAMYRALTLKIIQSKVKFEDIDRIIEVCKGTSIELDNNRVILDDVDVTEKIREPIVNSNVSLIAKVPEVRKILVEIQRQTAQGKSVVMDGRDIGTYVLPNAPYKFYLTAAISERAQRRYLELKNKGFNIGLKEIEDEIAQRDKIDQERSISPLKPAQDAIIINTTSKTIKQVVEEIIDFIYRG